LLPIRTKVLASRTVSNAAHYENDPETDPWDDEHMVPMEEIPS
jgi:hypothetical protein